MAKMSRKTKYLPMDLVYEVLLRLPAKTLVRFRSVCKPWNSLITHPPFEQDHYCRRQRNPLLLCLEGAGNGLFPSSYSNIGEEGFNLVNKSSLKAPNSCSFYKILSCQGMVCIAGSSIFIFNPVSGEHFALPPTEGFNVCIGFGYKASSQEFKVVKFYSTPKERNEIHYSPMESKEYCKVFTLGGEWREAKSPPYRVCHGDTPFLHEAFHLLHRRDFYLIYTISVFGIEREDYKEIRTPACVTGDCQCRQLTELRGSIYLVEIYWRNCETFLALFLLNDYEHEEWVAEYHIEYWRNLERHGAFWLLNDYENEECDTENNIDLDSVTTFCDDVNVVKPLAILGDGGILLHVRGRWVEIGRGFQVPKEIIYE